MVIGEGELRIEGSIPQDSSYFGAEAQDPPTRCVTIPIPNGSALVRKKQIMQPIFVQA